MSAKDATMCASNATMEPYFNFSDVGTGNLQMRSVNRTLEPFYTEEWGRQGRLVLLSEIDRASSVSP